MDVGEGLEPGNRVGLACARVVTGQRSGILTKATDSTLDMSWGRGMQLFTAIVARRPGTHGAKPDESADRLNYKSGGALCFSKSELGNYGEINAICEWESIFAKGQLFCNVTKSKITPSEKGLATWAPAFVPVQTQKKKNCNDF